jgi:hypothetical protein
MKNNIGSLTLTSQRKFSIIIRRISFIALPAANPYEKVTSNLFLSKIILVKKHIF